MNSPRLDTMSARFTIHRYIAVGIFNTLLGLGIALLLSLLGVHYAIAITVGYAAGFVSSFFLNKYYTFRSGGNFAKEFVLFAISTAIAYGVNEGLAWVFVNLVRYSPQISITISVGLAALVGYLINKKIVFSQV